VLTVDSTSRTASAPEVTSGTILGDFYSVERQQERAHKLGELLQKWEHTCEPVPDAVKTRVKAELDEALRR